MKSILKDIGEVVWGPDSRLFRTLRDYINPGVYTRNWLDKKQAGYISPVKMFLIINLVYFLCLSLLHHFGLSFDTFVTPFESQMHNQHYSEFIHDSASSIISSTGIETEEFAEIYDDRVFAISNSLIIILSLIVTPILYLVNFRKSGLLYHHLTIGLYYGGFLLLLFLIYSILLSVILLILLYLNTVPGWLISEIFSNIILVSALLLFSFLAQVRMYKEQKFISFLKSVFIIFFFAFAGIIIYRFILFWITFSSVVLFS